MSLILRAPLAMRIQARAVDWRSRRESLPVRRGWGERRGSMRAWIVTPPHLVDGNPLRRFETLTPPAPLSQPPPGLTGERGAGHPNKGGIALGCSPSSPGGRGGGWEKRAGVMRATAAGDEASPDRDAALPGGRNPSPPLRSPHSPSPSLPASPPPDGREGSRTSQQRRNCSWLFSLFSRRKGGRLGEEGRGDEGHGGAAIGPAPVALTRRRRTLPGDFGAVFLLVSLFSRCGGL